MLTVAFFRGLTQTMQGIHRLATHLNRVVKNRRALRQLSELDNHGLADIGLKRLDVSLARATPFYGDPFKLAPLDQKVLPMDFTDSKPEPFAGYAPVKTPPEQPCCSDLTGAAA